MSPTMNNSSYDGFELPDVDEAIQMLQDMISGAYEDRARDSRVTDVIRLLEHLKAKEALLSQNQSREQ